MITMMKRFFKSKPLTQPYACDLRVIVRLRDCAIVADQRSAQSGSSTGIYYEEWTAEAHKDNLF